MVWAKDAPAAGAALAKVDAASVDCDSMRQEISAKLEQLKTNDNEIERACHHVANSEVNNQYGSDGIKGACQSVYATINVYSDKVTGKTDEFCQVVDSAKTLKDSCQNQATCLRALAGKNRAAAKKLQQIATLYQSAQKELKARKKDLVKVANSYRDVLNRLREIVASSPDALALKENLACAYLPGIKDNFNVAPGENMLPALDSENGWQGTTPQQLKEILDRYDQAFPKAFPDAQAYGDGDGGSPIASVAGGPPIMASPSVLNQFKVLDSTSGGSVPAPTVSAAPSPTAPPSGTAAPAASDPLGEFTLEISKANTAATKAFDVADLTVPTVNQYESKFTQNAETIGSAAGNMGSMVPSGGGSVSSTLTGAQQVGTAATQAGTGASRAISYTGGGASSGSDGSASPGGAIGEAGAAASTGAPSGNSAGQPATNAASSPSNSGSTASSPAPLAAPSAAPAQASLTAQQQTGATDPTEADVTKPSKESQEYEILSSYGGPAKVIVAAPASANRPAVAKAGGASAASAAPGSMFGSTTGSAASQGSAPAAKENGVSLAGGLRGSPRGMRPEADPLESSAKAQGVSLREMLRRRLAERQHAGGDADASAAADSILDESMHGTRGLASVGAPIADGDEERAGPQSIDSEPLFSRVHGAHERFQLRAIPKHAGI